MAGNRNQKIDRSQTLIVGRIDTRQVGQNHALSTGKDIHLRAGTNMVIEAGQDLTIKGPGGFIRIDSSGITIKGTKVNINSGGAQAGNGRGAQPTEPDEAEECMIEPPDAPEPDDVSKTGLKQ